MALLKIYNHMQKKIKAGLVGVFVESGCNENPRYSPPLVPASPTHFFYIQLRPQWIPPSILLTGPLFFLCFWLPFTPLVTILLSNQKMISTTSLDLDKSRGAD